MKIKVCPSCGHEIYDRGKFCQFCGCELRGGKTVDRPDERADTDGTWGAGAAESGSWNPDKAYRGSAGRVLVVTLAAVFLVAAAVMAYTHIWGQEMRFPKLNSGMTFLQARQAMREDGFREDEAPYLGSFYNLQRYASREVFGIETVYSELEVQEGSYVAVGHMYYEPESGTVMNPGPVFRQLERNLNSSLGEGIRAEDGTYYYWRDRDKLMLMTYNTPDEVQIVIYYTAQDISL